LKNYPKYRVKNLKDHILGTFQRCNTAKEGMHV